MKFLVVEDVRPVLKDEMALIKELVPDSQVFGCTDMKEALEYASKEFFHVILWILNWEAVREMVLLWQSR